MSSQQVMNCSFSSWYSSYQNQTIRSHIIPLPQEFVDYLLQDGIVLPKNANGESEWANTEYDSDGEEDKVKWDTDETETQTAESPTFPELEKEITESIKSLGGKVFPKLNWSAPQDASWIALNQTLQCTCPNDIYLLLKSSDFVMHDLTKTFEYCNTTDGDKQNNSVQYDLILRKWLDIQPGMEFRCFVKDRSLIAISQRHHTQFYEFIKNSKSTIVEGILEFFQEHIEHRFPDDDFVFDVYIKSSGECLLLDFNPFMQVTDSLLYTWDELNSSAELKGTDSEDIDPAIRYVCDSCQVQPHPYASYAVPRDVYNLVSGTGHNELIDFLQLKTRLQNGENLDSSDEDECDDR